MLAEQCSLGSLRQLGSLRCIHRLAVRWPIWETHTMTQKVLVLAATWQASKLQASMPTDKWRTAAYCHCPAASLHSAPHAQACFLPAWLSGHISKLTGGILLIACFGKAAVMTISALHSLAWPVSSQWA